MTNHSEDSGVITVVRQKIAIGPIHAGLVGTYTAQRAAACREDRRAVLRTKSGKSGRPVS
jgi:hypothetical protein